MIYIICYKLIVIVCLIKLLKLMTLMVAATGKYYINSLVVKRLNVRPVTHPIHSLVRF